jgi:ADP-heptose:LPS heptosyltransferase
LLGDVLRECAALVTNESGMMHVAWAVKTPTVALAGPSNPRLTSPFGVEIKVLQHREVPCVPCVKNECYRPADESMECMRKIEVEEVLEALRKILRGARSGK